MYYMAAPGAAITRYAGLSVSIVSIRASSIAEARFNLDIRALGLRTDQLALLPGSR